jgi:hypothetical protein
VRANGGLWCEAKSFTGRGSASRVPIFLPERKSEQDTGDRPVETGGLPLPYFALFCFSLVQDHFCTSYLHSPRAVSHGENTIGFVP